jgi:16S rRNA (guanine527-N7)-methyltransferase
MDMEIGSKEWQNLIIDGARKLGIEIDEEITALFSIHARELIHWNRKINLTAITNPGEIAIQHFLDSLAPAGFIPQSARVLDIGAGGGFPGIPLKILKPSISVLLIDAVRKKVNFLKHVLRALLLENVEALHIRSEDLKKNPGDENFFDVVISRALSDLKSFVKSAMPLLAKQGKIIAMKGLVGAEELDRMLADMLQDRYSLEVENYKLPLMNAQRSIVVIKKQQ